MQVSAFKKALNIVLFVFVVLSTPVFAHAQVELLPAEKAWLSEHASEVTFAPEKDYPPFIWEQYSTLFGISKDYLNYIQVELETSFREKEARSLQEILEAVRSGESSIVSSVSATGDRSEYLIFTRPYFESPALFVGKSGTGNKSIAEIVTKKLRVGVGDGFGAHEYLQERYPQLIFVPRQNDFLVLEDLRNGKTDIAVIDAASMSYLTAEHEIRNLKKIGETGFVYSLAFAVPKSMPELRNSIDAVLGSMPKKVIEDIHSRWISDPATLSVLAGNSTALVTPPQSSSDAVTLILSATVMLLLGFVLHYLYVRITPRKDSEGHAEYVP
jgi:ABC-type amino acid transport substrate-binding protein